MKILTIMKIKIKNLYQLLLTSSATEWKENATAFFQDTLHAISSPKELTPEQIEKEEEAQWQEILAALLEGVDEKEIPLCKALLNNQHRYDNEKAQFDKTASRILSIPIVRRIWTQLTIKELVGVQPMDGPVSLVYKLRNTNKEETDEGTNLSLEILKQAVEAGSRKLRAAWTLETEQDLNTMHGIDIQAEVSTALAGEIAHEHNAEWLKRLSEIANESSYKINDNAALIVAINKAANDIAANTRRGAGNWIVVPPTTFTRIQEVANRNMSPRDMFVPSDDPAIDTGLKFVGTLNKTMKVYVNITGNDDEILVGYKGKTGEMDAGLIFAPYVMLMPTGPIVDSETFQPLMKFMTRYGVMEDEDSSKYYEKIKITYKDKK